MAALPGLPRLARLRASSPAHPRWARMRKWGRSRPGTSRCRIAHIRRTRRFLKEVPEAVSDRG